MKKLYPVGDQVQPCRTPRVSLKELDTSPFHFTFDVRSSYQLLRNNHFLPLRPTSYNLTSIESCHTLSNACVASTNIAFKLCFVSMDSLMASVSSRLPLDGDVFLVKPRWRGFCLCRISSFDSSRFCPVYTILYNSA